MKRFFLTLLIIALAFALFSCIGGAGDVSIDTSDDVSVDISDISEFESEAVSESPDESEDESEASLTESEDFSVDSEISENESAISEAESEVSEDVSAEESVYEVVYHTEYKPLVPLHTGDYRDEYIISDKRHVGYCFDYPYTIFFEYFGNRINNFKIFSNAFTSEDFYNVYFGFVLEYYKITKEEYIAFLDAVVDMNDPKAVEEFDRRYPLLRYVNGWYSENHWEDPLLIAVNAKENVKHYYAQTRDGKHNSLYYIIHEVLIEHVGEKEFKKFLKEYEGTTDCNILKFIEYFDIDYKEFGNLMAKTNSHLYTTRFVYGSKDEQEAYFGFYDDNMQSLNKFNPRISPFHDTVPELTSPNHDVRLFSIDNEFLIYFLGYDDNYPNVENPEKLHEFERLFGKTAYNNYAFFIKYYGITEEEWKNFLNEMYNTADQYNIENELLGRLVADFDLLFKEEHFLSSVKTEHFSSKGMSNYETYYAKVTDDRYNEIYYTIDRKLIEHVGIRAFNKFLEKYEGTSDCNIIKFLEFNDLSAHDVRYVYKKITAIPYNVSILYMDSDSEDFQKYFGYGTLER